MAEHVDETGRPIERATYGRRCYVGVTLFPYQMSLGLTLRWFERRPHLRLYVGPVKFYVGGFDGS